jgi:hypothetical protein
MVDLFSYCEDNKKALVAIQDGVDISTSIGKFIAGVLALIAEMERENVKARVQNQREAARKNADYTGLAFPFGYTPVKRETKGWELQPDPEDAKLVEHLFEKVCEQSATSLCHDLNREGVPAPRGGDWSVTGLLGIIRSRAVLGYVQHEGKLVTNDDGELVRRTPLVTLDLFNRANAAIGGPVKTAIKVHPTAQLSGLLDCSLCDAAMHVFRQTSRGKQFPYYRCSNKKDADGSEACPARSLRMGLADEAALACVIKAIGHVEIVEQIRTASNNDIRIAELNALIADIVTRLTESDDDNTDELLALTDYKRERKALKSETGADQWEYVATGQTWAEAIENLDTDGVRALFQRRGLRFKAHSVSRTEVAVEAFILVSDVWYPLAQMGMVDSSSPSST